MSRFQIGHTFQYGEQVTPKKLNDSVNNAEFGADAVDDTSIEVNIGKKLEVKSEGITNDKLADESVSSEKILGLSVTEKKIADDSVSTSKIQDNAITTHKIADGAVTQAKLGSGFNVLPPGIIMAYANPDTIPAGWLVCNGSAYSQGDYPELFKAIGYTWGNEFLKFKVPDYRGVTLRGIDQGRGLDPDREFASFQNFEIQSHNHSASASREDIHGRTVSDISGGNKGNTYWAWNRINDNPFFYANPASVQPSVTVNPTGGSETRMVNETTVYIIKT